MTQHIININREGEMSSVMSQTDSGREKMLDQTIEQGESRRKQLYTFVLVNSRSGSWHGREFIQKFGKSTSVKHSNNLITYFYMYDLYLQHQIDLCFQQAKKFVQQKKIVRIIIGGGDGTVEWVIEQSIKHKIDFKSVIFGILPIGTGNDFAHSVGWEKFNFQATENKIKQLAIRLIQCQIGSYDVWDCKVQCYNLGTITEIKNGKQKQLTEKSLSKTFTNYVGMGCDAQVSFLSQKINAKSVFLKKVAYGIAGLYSFCTFTKKLANKLVKFIQIGEKARNEQIQMNNKFYKEAKMQREIFQNLIIKSTDSCVTFLNSTHSMEISHIWQSPYSIVQDKKFKPQKVDDEMIQIVSYRNQFSLGLERNFHMAKKVGQGKGPFELNFKQAEIGKNQITYVHINGEPYKISNLKSIQIARSKKIPDSRINIFSYKKD